MYGLYDMDESITVLVGVDCTKNVSIRFPSDNESWIDLNYEKGESLVFAIFTSNLHW